ncbi:MAG: S41 family peptidase [Armatimonadota bacterium]|nr:S41 family peptidase [Armatimonadota bacterium]MCX7778467.1 S41 family peptidase [Armatimonadota bacterium]MDW8026046.1 S41 family peptidase [Armatimonadota bacterium]
MHKWQAWKAVLIILALVAAFGIGRLSAQFGKFGSLIAGLPESGVSPAGAILPSIAPIEHIDEAYRCIKRNTYNRDVKDKELVYGAIQGMLTALDDKHARFLTPEEQREFEIQTEGEFEGIGAELAQIPDPATNRYRITIVTVFPGQPAHKAGLQPMDRIKAIDGKPTDKMTLSEAVKLIRGPKGTPVTLTIERPGFEHPINVTLIRERIKVPTLKASVIETDVGKVGYIHLLDFSKLAEKELSEKLRKFKDEKVVGLILDLRDNPGGLLDAAVAVASRFVKGGPVVIVRDRYGNEDVYEARPENYAGLNVPLIVLVNRLSASASEIVAGAIKDRKLGKVVGERTFGKGSVQTAIPLKHGGSVILTTHRYLTPSRYDITEKSGIEPDVEIKFEDASLAEVWKERAREHIKLEQFEDALVCLRRALQLNPKDKELSKLWDEAWNGWGQRRAAGKPIEKDQELQQCLELLKQEIKSRR